MNSRKFSPAFFILLSWRLVSMAQSPASGNIAEGRDALFKGEIAIRKQVEGVHPRLFLGPDELAAVQNHYRKDPGFFQTMLPAAGAKALRPPPATLGELPNSMVEREALMAVGPALTRLTVLYRITGDERYWDAVKRWVPAIRRMQPVDIKEDLVVGYLLYNFSASYDLMKGAVDTATEAAFRSALIGQARDSYAAFRKRERFTFEQNHLIIPVSALALAGMALLDDSEVKDEAGQWLVFARNVLNISLDAIGQDGWFFEGIGYWNFTIPFPLAYAGALRRVTGENMLDKPLFKDAGVYLEHMFLPHPDFVFDFEDWGPRAEGNTFQRGYDWPWHTLPTRVNSLFLLPHAINSAYLQDVFFLLQPLDKSLLGDDRCASFAALWQQQRPGNSIRIKDGPDNLPYHYFPDMEVLHWRSNWSDSNATAFAFKSGPPGGHHIAALYHRYPEWQSGLGHAHPDLGSFILYSKGVFLANATGYTVKESRWQNTITVDGKSQGVGGLPWTTWAHFPYDSLDKVHLENIWMSSTVAAARAVFGGAYNKDMRVRQMERSFVLVDGRFAVILDEMRSDIPHVYDWFLHTDRQAEPAGEHSWKMENGPARLMIRSFGEASAEIAPTIVETEFYDPKKTRPQQRGFHIDLRSSSQNDWRLLTALCIQDKGEKASAFSAVKVGDQCVELVDGKDSCRIRIGSGDELEGDYGYVVKTKNKVREIGFSGKRFRTPYGIFSLDGGGQVVLHAEPGGKWRAEGAPMNAVHITAATEEDPAGAGARVALPSHAVRGIEIVNARPFDRTDEIVTLERGAFGEIPEGLFPLLSDGGAVPVFQFYDSDGDHRWDELLVQVTVKAKAEKTLSVRWVAEDQMPVLPPGANVRFSRRSTDGLPTAEIVELTRTRGFVQNIALPDYQMEGPGIENDKVAFRAFFDHRNTKDIYGKITDRMVLKEVGVAHPWHQLQDWGMDIFASGKTLGAGGLAIVEEGKLYGLGDADTSDYTFIDKGPLKAGFRLRFRNWDIGRRKGDGSEEITMEKGGFYYQDDIRVATTSHQLVSVGLGKIGLDTFYHKRLNEKISAIYCYGNQAAGTGSRLGTAVLFSTPDYLGSLSTSPTDSIPNTCIVELKPEENKKCRIYFVAGWEKTDARFATREGFEAYLDETAERLGYPLQIRFIK